MFWIQVITKKQAKQCDALLGHTAEYFFKKIAIINKTSSIIDVIAELSCPLLPNISQHFITFIFSLSDEISLVLFFVFESELIKDIPICGMIST